MLTRRRWLIGTGTTALSAILPAREINAKPREPVATTPEQLCALARRGLAERLGIDAPSYSCRLEHELSILVENPLAVRKLLVLHDVASFARSDGIELGSGRGSSSGSLVCWALGITDLDPVRHDLIFERFYDPTTTHEPFIDLDVCLRRRDELVDYLIARHVHVALVPCPCTDDGASDDPTLWFESRKILVAQSRLDATRDRWPTVDLGAWDRPDCVSFELIGQDILTEIADAGIGRPVSDRRVWNLLASGSTLDAYPLRDDGFPEVLRRVRPESLEELAAALALFRPGTLEAGWVDGFIDAKHRRRTSEPLQRIAAKIVEPTHGLIIYQEQWMRIVAAMTGVSLAEANRVRRDLGARRRSELHRSEFVERAQARGTGPHAAATLFARLQHDVSYTFSRAHALSLATLALRSILRIR